MSRNWIISSLFCCSLLACDREEIGPQSRSTPGQADTAQAGVVYVLNEGNFGRGNAGISTYQPLNQRVQSQAYRAANGGLPLGDVAQVMKAHAGKWYVALNGSSTLVRLDSASLTEEARLSGIGTPAGMAIKAGKAYLSDVYQSKLRRIDLSEMKIDTAVPLPGPGQRVVAIGEHLAVATSYGLVVWERSPLRQDTLLTTGGPVSGLASSDSQRLWALVDGSTEDSLLGWDVTGGQSAGKYALGKNSRFLRSNGVGDSLFWLQASEVWALKVAGGVPVKLFDTPVETPYGFNLDPYRGELYLCDALDFNQASLLYRYRRQGLIVDSFRTGPISNQVRFGVP